MRTSSGAEISATVKNSSSREGDEVVQLYFFGGDGEDAPVLRLRSFLRIHLRAGESRQVKFTVVSENVPKDNLEISDGGGQPAGNTPHVKGTLLRSQVVVGGATGSVGGPPRACHPQRPCRRTGTGCKELERATRWLSLQSDSLPPPDNTFYWKGPHA